MPDVGRHRRAADRGRVLVVALIQIQPQLTGAGDRQFIAAASARLPPRFATNNVLVVAVGRVELDPCLDCDWTTDVNRRAVWHAHVTARSIQRKRVLSSL